MTNDFDAKLEKWIELICARKINEAYNFYWSELYCTVEERFLKKVRESGQIPQYDELILPAGLDYAYYVLLIKALKPKHTTFVCTKEFRDDYLDKVIEKSNLKRSEFSVKLVEYFGMDVAEVYGKIKDELEKLEGKKVAIDLTRGKRVMTVGAGIIGAFFGFDLVYVDEEWLDDIKRGKPGTENLVQVKNPFEVFGDLEQRYAIQLFNRHEYGAAAIFFKRLSEKVMDPREFEVKKLISEAYNYWDAFNYNNAEKILERAIAKIKQYNLQIREQEQLSKNLKVLSVLKEIHLPEKNEADILPNENLIIHLMVDLHLNGFRRKDQHRLEDSITRFYRVVEIISQHRLAKKGIISATPEYHGFEELSSKYKEITKKLYGTEKELPVEIGIKDGHIILFILNDELWKTQDIKHLEELFGPIRARDTSIIAHGIALVGSRTFDNLQKLSRELIDKLCKFYNKNINEVMEMHKFIEL